MPRRKHATMKCEQPTVCSPTPEDDDASSSLKIDDTITDVVPLPSDKTVVPALRKRQLKRPLSKSAELDLPKEDSAVNLHNSIVETWPKRRRPVKKVPELTRDLETGAFANCSGKKFVTKNKSRYKIEKSASLTWLTFWNEDEKKELLKGLRLHGTKAPLNVLKTFVPHRSTEDIKELLKMLELNAKRIVASTEFILPCGMSAPEILQCKEPFIRIPAEKSVVVEEPVEKCLKTSFLEATETAEEAEEAVDEETIDFDRLYRVIANSLDAASTVHTLRALCSLDDVRFLGRMLLKNEAVAKQLTQDSSTLFRCLESRLKLSDTDKVRESNLLYHFSTEIPTGELGETAHGIACTPDANPLRLRPEDLIMHDMVRVADEDANEVQMVE